MRHLRVPTLLLLVLALGLGHAAGAGPATEPAEDLARWVDPLIGTAPPGFVFPGAARPWGMVQNSPDTEGPFAYGGYLRTDQLIRGFSLVHVSGPGVPKGGDIPLMPTVGPVTSSSPFVYGSPWDRATETAEPGWYAVRLAKGPKVELTATQRVAVQRYTFPPSPQANVLLDVSRTAKQAQQPALNGLQDAAIRVVSDTEVEGWTRGKYPVYFVARFDRPFSTHGTWKNQALTPGGAQEQGVGTGGWVSFDLPMGGAVTAKIGVSFVDTDGARRNLDAELPGWDVEAVRADARAAWNEALSAIRVRGGIDLERTSFYSALYRSLLHPNVFTDTDGRYRGMDDQVHTAAGRTQYANFSSWDTYKGHNQLIATLFPERYAQMVASQLDNARRQGRIPRFGEQSYDAGHMSGDPAIPMIVDGYCRGALAGMDVLDLEELYAEMAELATTHRPAELRALGWLPGRPGTTLEYGVADFALALMAAAMGKPEDAQRWLAQAGNWRNILDPETGWVRPRNADGSWHSPFDPSEETGFQEGNSWQYSWLAPHDAAGVFAGMGGDAVAAERLDDLFAYEAASRTPLVVGEAQSRLNVFGTVYRTPTYAPGNEHDLQVPWMYPFAGQPWKTQAVHRQLQGLFRPTVDGLPGNDDLGGLSAWFVWSALGVGPVTPGAPFYVVGSPMFERAELRLPGRDRAFTIEAPGASLLAKHVRNASLDGRPLERSWFGHDKLAAGKTLRLEMSTQADTGWANGPEARPPSASTNDLSAFGCNPG